MHIYLQVMGKIITKIIINNIQEEDVFVYQDEEFIGVITNIYQFLDIRLQVVANKIENVYFTTKNRERANIKSDGSLDYWPTGFFNLVSDKLYELIKIKYDNKRS